MIEHNHISVVVIDDEPHVLEGLESLIPWEDHKVTRVEFFSDAVEAYHYLEEHPVDIIITDVRMPEMTGIDLIERIKETHAAIEIIVMSGYKEFDYVKQVMALGARGYLVKSIFEEDLLGVLLPTIDEVLRRRSIEGYEQAYDEALLNRYLHDEKQLDPNQYAVLQESFLSKYPDSGARVAGLWFDENDHDLLYEQLINIAPTLSWLHEADMVYIVLLSDNEAKDVMQLQAVYPSLNCDYLGPVTSLKDLKDIYERFMKQLKLMHHYRVNKGFFIDEVSRENMSQKPLKPYVSQIVDAIHLGDEEGVFESFRKLIENMDQENLSLDAYRKGLILFLFELVNGLVLLREEKDDLYGLLPEKVSKVGLEELITFIESKLYQMIQFARASREQYKDEFRTSVEAYINGHITSQITIKDMAEALHMHPNYMGKKLRNELGESFSLYLNRRRIDLAKGLFHKEDHLTIEEVAYKIGYSSYPLFLKYFKLFNDLTPKAYVQSLKNEQRP